MTTQWKYSNIYKAGVYRILDNGDIERAEEKDLPVGTAILPPDVDNAYDKTKVLAEFKSLRDIALARLTGIQLDATVQTDIDAIKIAKQSLIDMSTHPSVVSAVSGDETEDTLQLLYANVAAQLLQAAPTVYNKFHQLDF